MLGKPRHRGHVVLAASVIALVAAVVAAEKVVPHEFEEVRYFEGCLPVEVMAERGLQTLAFGPMKPDSPPPSVGASGPSGMPSVSMISCVIMPCETTT